MDIIADDLSRCTCMKCLKSIEDDDGFVYEIRDMGYGSIFDSFNSDIILCKNCYIDSGIIWSQEIVVSHSKFDYAFYKLRYEDDIEEYINSFPIEGQELFYNRIGSGGWNMDPIEWIEMHMKK